MDSHVLPNYSYTYQKILAKLNFYLLLGIAATLLFDKGRYKALNYLVELVTLILAIGCCVDNRNTGIRKQIFAGLTVIVMLLFNQAISGEAQWPKSEIKDLVFMFCVMAAVVLIPKPMNTGEIKYRTYAVLLLIAIASTSYITMMYFLGHRYSVFENPHFLSLHVVILVNMTIFYSLKYTGISRIAGITVLAVSIFTLTLIGKRIEWVALAASLFVWAALVFQHIKYIRKYACFVAVFGLCITALVSYSDGPIKEVVTARNYSVLNLWQDERLILWADTIEMQKNSDLKGWLVGHGFGGFEDAFSNYSSYSGQKKASGAVEFVFPHNFILEILYNNGILGLLILSIPLGYIVFGVFQNTQGRSYHAILALALLAGVFIHTFFTLPLFTRFPSTSLGLILGYCMWINRDAAYHARVS